MSEVALTADDLVVIGRGRILETTTVAAFVAEHSAHSIRVATPEPDKLHAVFETAPQVTVREGPAMPTTRSKAGCSALKVPHWSRLRGRSPTRRRSTRPARYRGRCRPNTASLPQPNSAEHAGGAAMTQPHIPSQPQPVPSLGVARLVFLGHEVTPLAADEWRIPLIGLLVFKKSDIK